MEETFSYPYTMNQLFFSFQVLVSSSCDTGRFEVLSVTAMVIVFRGVLPYSLVDYYRPLFRS
jgi:hypothetical protein